MSRGTREPYHASPEWSSVTRMTVDRDAEDAEGAFGEDVAALLPRGIDLVCFTAASAQQLVEALRPSRPLLVHCGTIWVHGPALRVPVTEDEPRTAYGEYGTGKAEIEALLHRETLARGSPLSCCTRVTSAGPAGRSLPLQATWIPASGRPGHRQAARAA